MIHKILKYIHNNVEIYKPIKNIKDINKYIFIDYITNKEIKKYIDTIVKDIDNIFNFEIYKFTDINNYKYYYIINPNKEIIDCYIKISNSGIIINKYYFNTFNHTTYKRIVQIIKQKL